MTIMYLTYAGETTDSMKKFQNDERKKEDYLHLNIYFSKNTAW